MKTHARNSVRASVFSLAAGILFLSVFVLAGKGPRIKFKEESWDFGRVKMGEVLTHVFVFQNEGDATLEIKEVRTSCGCTAALVSEKKVAPGGQGEVKVTVNTRGFEGQVAKYAYVETNDQEHPKTQLTVLAGVDVPPQPKIELDRYSQDVGLILEGEDILAIATLKNRGELELSVTPSHPEAAFFFGNREISAPIAIAAGEEVKLTIKIPPRPRTGLLREYIMMKSNDPLRSNLSLYISGYVITKKQLKELFQKYKNIVS